MQWGRKTKHFLQTVGLLFEDVGQSSIGRVEIESDKREREREGRFAKSQRRMIRT